jgi:hypothetical protein
MGAAASFGFGEPSAREKPRVDYNKLLKLSFYDFVQCDSTRRTLVSRGQRLVRYMMHFCPRADGRPNNRGATLPNRADHLVPSLAAMSCPAVLGARSPV